MIVAVTLVVCVFIFNQSISEKINLEKERLALEERELLINAVYQCGQVISANWRDLTDGTQITEPYEPAYNQCLLDKKVK